MALTINYGDLLFVLKTGIVFFVLIVFSIYDLRYRDIPDKYVWGFLGVGIGLFISSIPYYLAIYGFSSTLAYVLLSIIFGSGLPAALYFMGYMGAADVWVLATLSLIYPHVEMYNYVLYKYNALIHIPPIFMVIFYSSIIYVLMMPFKALYTYIRYRDKIPESIGFGLKILYLFTGTPMRVSEYLVKKHYYPLMRFRVVNGVLRVDYRASFHAEKEDYRIHQEELRRLLEDKLLSPDTYIWVTYGIPFMVPILIGMIVLYLIGDYPLLLLFSG